MDKIVQRIDQLFDKIKNNDSTSYVSTALFILLGIYIVSLIWYYIQFGFSGYILVYFLLLPMAAVYYRFSMLGPMKAVEANSNYESYFQVDDGMYKRSKIQYLLDGIDIKLTRINSVKFIYLVLVPFLFVMLREILVAPVVGFGSLVFQLFLAAIIGGVFWIFFFNSDKEDLLYFEDDLTELMNNV